MNAARAIACIATLGAWLSVQAAAPVPVQKFASSLPTNHPSVPAAVLANRAGEPWQHAEPGPVPGLREYAREASGARWLGSPLGAARFDPAATHPWDRWQYFAGRRWLSDDAVRNIVVQEPAADGTRRVWIATSNGVGLIEWRPMTLEQKAARFEERIEARHVRHGFVSDSHLPVAGDLASNVRVSNDNDGLWTAIYLGAEGYRYAITRAPDARDRARRALDALLRLEEITSIPGYIARSFVSTNEPLPGDGEWHRTADGKWIWKSDTSSDELVGHYFAYATYFDLVATDAEKPAIRAVIRRMTDYLMAHDYDLLDVDGRPTRWGEFSERFFGTAEGRYEAPLRSIELLGFLRVAYHLTGDPRYEAAYQDRVRRGYADHIPHYRRWPGGGEINYSDDELAFFSFEPLLKYEKDPVLRAKYLDGLRFTAGAVRANRNPLWNYIAIASGAGPMTPDLREESLRTLDRYPNDLVGWTVRNRQRTDISWRPGPDRHNQPETVTALPPDERVVARWNSNPFTPDGGSGGHHEDDGAAFLLPYWYGRYHGWVE